MNPTPADRQRLLDAARTFCADPHYESAFRSLCSAVEQFGDWVEPEVERALWRINLSRRRHGLAPIEREGERYG